LKRSASWWAPWLLISAVSLGFIYTIDREIGFAQVAQNEIAKNPRQSEQIEKLPADQKAKAMRLSITITRVFSYATPVVIPIIYLIVAAVLMGTFNLGAGASVSFGTSLAIVFYGSLPGVLHALLGVISLIAGGMSGSLDKEAFNIRNAVATNPGYFMDSTANKFLYGIASALDVFTLWTVVLIGVGFACNSKVKRGSAIGIVLAWYLGYKLIFSALGWV